MHVTSAPNNAGARCRNSISTPTLRSSASRKGSSVLRDVRSSNPIKFGVLNTAGIPSVAKSIACFCSTVNCNSPVAPILGEDFTENQNEIEIVRSGRDNLYPNLLVLRQPALDSLIQGHKFSA